MDFSNHFFSGNFQSNIDQSLFFQRLGSSWQLQTSAAKLKVQSLAVKGVLSFMGYEPPEVKMTDQDGKK